MNKITKEYLVNVLDTYLLGWEYGDIERASNGGAKLASFILGSCFIDAMAGFYAGVDKENCKYGSGGRFKDFVAKYMPQYDKERLWGDLRCGLVHSYAAGELYVFTDANKAGKHFENWEGKIVLNLEDFCKDLVDTYKLFRKDILEKDEIFIKAKKRIESMGLMGPINRET